MKSNKVAEEYILHIYGRHPSFGYFAFNFTPPPPTVKQLSTENAKSLLKSFTQNFIITELPYLLKFNFHYKEKNEEEDEKASAMDEIIQQKPSRSKKNKTTSSIADNATLVDLSILDIAPETISSPAKAKTKQKKFIPFKASTIATLKVPTNDDNEMEDTILEISTSDAKSINQQSHSAWFFSHRMSEMRDQFL